jgi:membrane fusion protein, multidrug efflux system
MGKIAHGQDRARAYPSFEIRQRGLAHPNNGTPYRGRLQFIDNQVDARSGTVRVRAMFENAGGSLMPGQFARLRMGQSKTEPALLVNERAVGTDQSKRFVLVFPWCSSPSTKAAAASHR